MSGMTPPMPCLPLHWRPANTDANSTSRETILASAPEREEQQARADD